MSSTPNIKNSPESDLLEQARHMLLPGLWDMFPAHSYSAHISIGDDGNIIVCAWKRGEPESTALGFAILACHIQDGHYKTIFAPACRKLRDLIDDPQGAEHVREQAAKLFD